MPLEFFSCGIVFVTRDLDTLTIVIEGEDCIILPTSLDEPSVIVITVIDTEE